MLKTVKLAILELKRYELKSDKGLLIAPRTVNGDYEQHLGIIESAKKFKERRRNE